MVLGIEVDRISDLPKNIIDSILTRLKIQEAARTSILSRSWRYQWHSLSKIIIEFEDLKQVSQVVRAKIIDDILLFHKGSVDKFKLGINLETSNDIDRWILYVSRNGIKELIIYTKQSKSAHYYNLPSCLLSCSELTHLELTCCIFMSPPAAFKGFSNLIELRFELVEITNRTLENLINSCPLLSKLWLFGFRVIVNDYPSLKINAPNLVVLHIINFHCFSQLTCFPLLTSASFGMESCISSRIANNKDSKIFELLGSMPILQRLEFREYALRELAVGDVPVRLPLVCPIKSLHVYINFKDSQELLAAFCILRSSPFIRILHIRADSWGYTRISADAFWKGEHDFNFRFDHLQEVSVTFFSGNAYELKFIKFLLANAPALKRMTIGFPYEIGNESIIIAKLVRFPRASPNANFVTMFDS